MASSILSLAIISTVIFPTFPQVPIPTRKLGYIYGYSKNITSLNIDMFLGPLCPDSQAAFPTLLKVADFYGPEVLTLRAHMFPLPYHRNAFLAAMGSHVINAMSNQSPTHGPYAWLEAVYNKIESFSNDATKLMSEQDVISKFGDVAEELGFHKTTFVDKMKDEMIDQNTRIGWKYTCTRGIAWTPAFTINDVLVQATPSWTVDDWKKVLDPLLNEIPEISNIIANRIQRLGADCKIGTKRCEYLPGKVECCKKPENCIPNVGCRC